MVAFAGLSTDAGGAGSVTVDPGLPPLASSADTLAMILLSRGGESAPTMPSGWSLRLAGTHPLWPAGRVWVWTADYSASTSFSFTAAAEWYAALWAVRGVTSITSAANWNENPGPYAATQLEGDGVLVESILWRSHSVVPRIANVNDGVDRHLNAVPCAASGSVTGFEDDLGVSWQKPVSDNTIPNNQALRAWVFFPGPPEPDVTESRGWYVGRIAMGAGAAVG